ncbi:MAG: PilN domain-containing protein [Candidatus Daviesbacteria bacterium]|nr:MAG: PilN domain-containing protein [Candidatus Daviesbacteria bacterium]
MPDKKGGFAIRLNLLHPVGSKEPILAKFIRWLLSSGRYIVIVVEAVVLIAFLSRFKFDADLQNTKEEVEAQLPFVQSLSSDEALVRRTQLQLSTVKDIRLASADLVNILNQISAQVPPAVKLTVLNLSSKVGVAEVKITGQSASNRDITVFFNNLKTDRSFKDLNIGGIGLNQGVVVFTITGNYYFSTKGNLEL